MAEFEYRDVVFSESEEEEVIYAALAKKKKKRSDHYMAKISKEMNLYHAALFNDTFSLIDSFIKSKKLTYESFLIQFDAKNFHQIYGKPTTGNSQPSMVSPHHYIATTQEALSVATKFLRSRSEKARIGALYLLYTMYKSQPLKTYPVHIKMEPKDYASTKELVEKCLNDGLKDPAYCFYFLDMKKKITISASVVSPCLEASYPRPEIREHMARVADNYFLIEYEERKELDLSSKFQMMEQQTRSEITYLNKLSNLCLGRDVCPEYKPELSKTLADLAIKNSDQKAGKVITKKSDEPEPMKKTRYKHSNVIAFPGVNEDILEDMVTVVEPKVCTEKPDDCSEMKTKKPTKKRKQRIQGGKKNTSQTPSMKEEPSTSSLMPKLSSVLDSESNSSSSSDSDNSTKGDDPYGDMIWRLLENGEP